jgi:hypothetical protein
MTKKIVDGTVFAWIMDEQPQGVEPDIQGSGLARPGNSSPREAHDG